MKYVVGAICCGLPVGIALAYVSLCIYFARGIWR